MQKLMNDATYFELKSTEEINALINKINWEDSFVKESHLFSPCFLIPEGIAAAESKPSLRMAICLPENKDKIIEFHFYELEDFTFITNSEICPSITIRHNDAEFKFCEQSRTYIRCKTIYFKLLENYYAGDCPIYTDEDLY